MTESKNDFAKGNDIYPEALAEEKTWQKTSNSQVGATEIRTRTQGN